MREDRKDASVEVPYRKPEWLRLVYKSKAPPLPIDPMLRHRVPAGYQRLHDAIKATGQATVQGWNGNESYASRCKLPPDPPWKWPTVKDLNVPFIITDSNQYGEASLEEMHTWWSDNEVPIVGEWQFAVERWEEAREQVLLMLERDLVPAFVHRQDGELVLAEKAQDEAVEATDKKKRHIIRRKFWTQLILEMNNRSNLYQNISPGIASWISAGSGMRGVGFNFGATKTYGRAEVYIDRGNSDENKWVFDQLLEQRSVIENAFGGSLVWERLDQKSGCRIKAEEPGNIYDPDQCPSMIEFMVDAMSRMELAFRGPLDEINRKLRTKS